MKGMKSRGLFAAVLAVGLLAACAATAPAGDLTVGTLTATNKIEQTKASSLNYALGKFGIGTTLPTDALHVKGMLKMENGNIKLNNNWLSGDGHNEGLYVRSDGKVGVNSVPTYNLDIKGDILRVANSGNANSQYLCDRYSTAANRFAYLSFRKSHTDAFGALATTLNDEHLGWLSFSGVDSTNANFRSACTIVARQDGAASATSVPGRFEFQTSTPSAAFLTRMTIRSDGKVGIGTTAPSEQLHVAGIGRFDGGIAYVAPLGDLSMGSYTNRP